MKLLKHYHKNVFCKQEIKILICVMLPPVFIAMNIISLKKK